MAHTRTDFEERLYQFLGSRRQAGMAAGIEVAHMATPDKMERHRVEVEERRHHAKRCIRFHHDVNQLVAGGGIHRHGGIGGQQVEPLDGIVEGHIHLHLDLLHNSLVVIAVQPRE